MNTRTQSQKVCEFVASKIRKSRRFCLIGRWICKFFTYTLLANVCAYSSQTEASLCDIISRESELKIGEQSTKKEGRKKKTDVPKQTAPHNTTRLSLYSNGAIVNSTISQDEVAQNQSSIPGLSSAVDESSIVINPPEAIILESYWLADENVSKKQKKEHSVEKRDSKDERTQAAPHTRPSSVLKKVVLQTASSTTPAGQGAWGVQYLVRDIEWKAHHVIEFTRTMEYITVSSAISVSNRSHINFSDAMLQFCGGALPTAAKDEAASGSALEQKNKAISPTQNNLYIYRYDKPCSLAAYEKRTIVWSKAKRVAISTSNGLFVGGRFLGKMDEVVFPQIENWISFPNTKSVGLGRPLPRGDVAIYYSDCGFSSLIGHTEMQPIKSNEDVMIRIPWFNTRDSEYAFVTAQLKQEFFRILTPTMAEAEYVLIVKNLKDTTISLNVTVNNWPNQRSSVASSNTKHSINDNKEIVWLLDVNAKETKELRYKLIIVTQQEKNGSSQNG
ncbi:MAG: hypothetical protein LBF72_03395 [Holosporales bacterium]|jgi:hypothetical protein|nr:hypothetical protein [Holosporales bacterium]